MRSPGVDRYLAEAPAALRGRLRALRSAIRTALPAATELVSYRMPGYGFPGYRYGGVAAWFAWQSGHLGLYLRPPTIERHRRELAGYTTTKSAVHLPLDRAIPTALVQRLVRASARVATAPEHRSVPRGAARSRRRARRRI